ncbi:hypothetical protein AVEN_194690-1 [Araneus ventricosus]|uniref:Uncharacterized protein n=1 Tax=Araneus ventricosus TaxID=182803 RepID=A0A4Y2U503_ARAVE|nr:hypothetical protein AVEN_194690-1 [Araneus ventricosus]
MGFNSGLVQYVPVTGRGNLSNSPKECYDAFLQLTKGASLAKRLAKISRGQNASKQVQNSSVEILTSNLRQSFDLQSLRISLNPHVEPL